MSFPFVHRVELDRMLQPLRSKTTELFRFAASACGFRTVVESIAGRLIAKSSPESSLTRSRWRVQRLGMLDLASPALHKIVRSAEFADEILCPPPLPSQSGILRGLRAGLDVALWLTQVIVVSWLGRGFDRPWLRAGEDGGKNFEANLSLSKGGTAAALALVVEISRLNN